MPSQLLLRGGGAILPTALGAVGLISFCAGYCFCQKLHSFQKGQLESYPYLVDGNQPSGGAAPGGKTGGGAAKGNLGGTTSERQAPIAARFPDLPK